MENFVEKGFFMMNFIHYFHPCPHGKILCHVNFDSILNSKEYSKNILSASSKDFLKIISCSPAHIVHPLTFSSHTHKIMSLVENHPR
jgi:hypothetical protein